MVSVTADAYVNKGPGRPVFRAEQRAGMLRALRVVDDVVVSEAPDAVQVIETLRPSVYVKGSDYQREDVAGNLDAERCAVESVGGTLIRF